MLHYFCAAYILDFTNTSCFVTYEEDLSRRSLGSLITLTSRAQPEFYPMYYRQKKVDKVYM